MMFDVGMLAGLVIVVGEILKKLGVDAKWIPVANIVLGILIGLNFGAYALLAENIVWGIMVAAGAGGIYSNKKWISETVNPNSNSKEE